nr:MAG TPA: hypothetical protein [Caudoviricetes sp.]
MRKVVVHKIFVAVHRVGHLFAPRRRRRRRSIEARSPGSAVQAFSHGGEGAGKRFGLHVFRRPI